eukprot:5027650-Lingulodinium_polyedra.AAC.1
MRFLPLRARAPQIAGQRPTRSGSPAPRRARARLPPARCDARPRRGAHPPPPALPPLPAVQ